MQLIAWRTTGKNPCDDPPVHITIAPVEKMTQVYPWILPYSRAEQIFGEVVHKIGEEPVAVTLSLGLDKGTPSKLLP